MKRVPRTLPLMALLAVAIAAPVAAADEPPPLKHFAVTFTTGPAWDKAKPPNEQKHFAEHSKNLQRLRQEGKVPLGARYADKGLVIVTAPSLEAVKAEFANDPAVTDGVFVHDIAEFSVFFPGTVERPKKPVDPPAPQPGVALPAELNRVLRDYEARWGAKDAAGLAALFAEDGFVLSSGKHPVRGRAAIAQAYAGMGGPLFLRAYAFDAEGDAEYIIGGYRGKEDMPDEGKFTLTLTRQGNAPWLIMSDMDNFNTR
jgi:ketosteroid isomerase-like protein/uncharacterized protein YciI